MIDKVEKQLRKEFKWYKKQAKRCKKTYSDWEDNEYNILDNKFIFAIPATKLEVNPSFNSLNDFTVYYNRSTQMYHMQLDPILFTKQCTNTLDSVYEQFKEFVYNYYSTPTDSRINEMMMSSLITNASPSRMVDGIYSATDLYQLVLQLGIIVRGCRIFEEENS